MNPIPPVDLWYTDEMEKSLAHEDGAPYTDPQPPHQNWSFWDLWVFVGSALGMLGGYVLYHFFPHIIS